MNHCWAMDFMSDALFDGCPFWLLSRQAAGTRSHSLIVNLLGRPEAIDICPNAIFVAIPYCLALIGGVASRLILTFRLHSGVVKMAWKTLLESFVMLAHMPTYRTSIFFCRRPLFRYQAERTD